MKKFGVIALVGLISVSMLAGCGSKKAKTPKEAAELLVKSIEDEDRDQFTSLFQADEGQKETLAAIFDLSTAGSSFERAMVKEYGQDAVNKAKGGKDGPGLSMIPSNKENLDKLIIKENGDKATITSPGAAKPVDLVRVDGGWKFLLPPMPATSKTEMDQALKMLGKMAAPFNNAKAKIGKKDYTPEKIYDELGKDFMSTMFSAMGEMKPKMGPPTDMPKSGEMPQMPEMPKLEN